MRTAIAKTWTAWSLLPGSGDNSAVDPAAPARSLSGLGIDDDFILFVSTFEPRKNHFFVFAAWRRLLSERGLASTPLLVCVGRRDWMFDEINRARVADPSLGQRIRILSDVSDPELVKLYHQCRFIIYPSRYEGWGLPVSEALKHGKVPLVARVAALPEAGGEFAEYFDLADADDFDRKLRRLIDDAAYREAREQEIATRYRPISAAEVVQELVEVVAGDGWSVSPMAPLCEAAPLSIPLLPLDIYLPLSRNREAELSHVVSSGTVYRMGSGWEAPDEQGCRLRDSDALLRMRLAGTGPHLLYLFCANSLDCELRLSVEAAPGGEWYCAITGQGRRCIPVRLAPDHSGECTVRLRVEADPGSSRGDAHPDFSALRLIGLYACCEADERSRQRFSSTSRLMNCRR
jgi:hypothetical protein